MELNRWTEVNPGVWKPEKDGDSIEGTLIDKEQNIGKNNSWLYHLDDGNKKTTVWGCAVLDERMKFVQIGQLIKITFVKKTKSKAGRDLNIYKVYVA